MRVTAEYNLGKLYPYLANQWHPTNNGQLTPFEVAPGSHKKVWWKCSQGHEWKVTVNSRIYKGSGCPKCYDENRSDILRKAALKKSGSLADQYPELVKEWHPTKNALTPSDVTPGSHNKVWWICSRGHEWKASVRRGIRGNGCRKCYDENRSDILRKAALKKSGSLADQYPELVKEWHPTKNKDLTADQVTPGSHKKVWWRCRQGHEWKAVIQSRTHGAGCKKCFKENRSEILRKAALKRIGSLAAKYPNLANEWHPTKNKELTPEEVTPKSDRKVWWRCNKGHEWSAPVKDRTGGHGCAKCFKEVQGDLIRKAVVKKRGSLATNNPDLAKQWHPTKNMELTPDQIAPRSGRKVWWRCNRDHEWKATIASRADGRGCPYCHPQTSRVEIRIYCEIKTIFDDVKWREKIDGIECDIYLPKYKVGIEIDGYPWHNGNEERDILKGKQFLEKGVELFRIRDERLLQISKTDMFYRHSERHISVIKGLLKNLKANVSFMQEDELKISEYFELNQLQNRQEYRKIIALLPGPLPKKSLAQLYPKLANEWNYEKNEPLKLEIFTPGSNKRVWWRCSQGHEWVAIINSRKDGRGCPYCAGKKPSKDYNLAIKYPKLAKEWHPTKNGQLTPFEVTPGSHKKVWWVCSRDHEWKATIASRADGRGCPKCYLERRRSK